MRYTDNPIDQTMWTRKLQAMTDIELMEFGLEAKKEAARTLHRLREIANAKLELAREEYRRRHPLPGI